MKSYIIKIKNPNKPMQTFKPQNHEFLSQLIGLCFPQESKDMVIFPPECPFLLNQAPYGCHQRFYITPKHYSTADKEIISESPFGFFKPEIEQQICSPEDSSFSAKFWEQILYLPGLSLYCLKSEYLTL